MVTTGVISSMKMIRGQQVAALLHPRPAVLVTCCDEHGVPNVLTIAWHTPLSHDPPLLGISVAVRRYSHDLILKNGEFVLNVVHQEFQPAVELCGNQSGRDLEKFAAAGLALQPAVHVRPPLIAGALAHLECVLENHIQAGDHTLFIGRVVCAQAQPSAFQECWMAGPGDVLLCVQRDQYGIYSPITADLGYERD